MFFQLKKYSEYDNKIILLKDSLYTEINKNKEYVYKNQALELSINDLKNINIELYDEIKKLNDNPKVVIKTVTNIEYINKPLIDTIKIDTLNKKTSILWGLHEDYSNGNYLSLNGESVYNSIDSTSYSNLKNLNLSIKVYNSIVKDKKGNYIITARTDFPGVKFDTLNGYIINDNIQKKKKKFGLSMFLGPIYEPRHNVLGVGVGIGLTYDIFQF